MVIARRLIRALGAELLLGIFVMTKLKKVFLSHSFKDKDFVRQLAADLKKASVPVWFDEFELKVGDSLNERIGNGIVESGYFAVVLSRNSVESKWVQKELNSALAYELQRKSVFVLPILLEKCDIPAFLLDKFYADFSSNYHAGLKSLLQRVGAVNLKKVPESKREQRGRLIYETYVLATYRGKYPAMLKAKSHSKQRGVAQIFPGQRTTVVEKKGKWICVEFFDEIDQLEKSGWFLTKYFKKERKRETHNATRHVPARVRA
jgi:hypothetical protein